MRAASVRPGIEGSLIVIGLVLLTVAQDQRLGADGLARYDALRMLLEQGQLSDTIYSMIGPLFAAPVWLFGALAGDVDIWLRHYNVIIFALGIGVTYWLLRDLMDRDLLRRFLLLLVAGSMIAPNVNNFYGETFTMLGVGLGILAVLARHSAVGWSAIVLGAANTPASLVGLGFVSLAETVHAKRLRYLIPAVVGGLLVLAEIGLRRGFDAEYTNNVQIAKTVMPYSGLDGFSYPFFFGVLAILFSFGKGLVFYLPGILLPVRKRLREIHDPAGIDLYRAYLLWMLFLGGLVLAYATWWSWYGGDWWGPRFFLLGILPASLALAVAIGYRNASLLANLAALAILILSIWIGFDSLILGAYWPGTCFVNYYQYAFLCHFTPEFSSLWYPFVDKPTLAFWQLAVLVYYAFVLLWLAAPLIERMAKQIAAIRIPRNWTF
ncbi:hypothetical protein [Rhizocola hellebori]|uniref:hypothetical protein n=1 Tax=Rhizocola hellebori TaxID=1392758 RepID=UPI001945AE8E|nr:hypothetical protein [Rhizocola hellebori]